MLNVVLVHPEIPHNTGAIGRLCLSTGSKLHLIKPLGFDLDEKAVKRAGLDYWERVDLVLWESLEEFLVHIKETAGNCYYLTTKTETPYWDAEMQDGDYFFFGAETKGLPESLITENPAQCLTIPIDKSQVRSLNLATSVGIVLFEAVRQANS